MKMKIQECFHEKLLLPKNYYSSPSKNKISEKKSVYTSGDRLLQKRRQEILDSYFNLKNVNYPVFVNSFCSKNPLNCPSIIPRLSSRYKPLRRTEQNLNDVKNYVRVQNFQFEPNPEKIAFSQRQIPIPQINSDNPDNQIQIHAKTLSLPTNPQRKLRMENKVLHADKNINTNTNFFLNLHKDKRSKSSSDLRRINIMLEGISNYIAPIAAKNKIINFKRNKIILGSSIPKMNKINNKKSSTIEVKKFRYHLIKSHPYLKEISNMNLKDKLQKINSRNNTNLKKYALHFATQKSNNNYEENTNININLNKNNVSNLEEDDLINSTKFTKSIIKTQYSLSNNLDNPSIFRKCIEKLISDELKQHSFYISQKCIKDKKIQKEKNLFTSNLQRNMPYFLKYLHINN